MEFKLREWELSDVASLAEHANNIRIWQNVRDYFPHPYTESDAYEFIQMVKGKSGQVTDFAVEIENKAVGGIGIVLNSDVERISVEIGYWLGESYWGNGIATEAIKRMSEYAFKHFDIVKIYASVFEYNTASMAVLRKNNYELEAILKKAAIKENRIIDIHYFSLFKEERR